MSLESYKSLATDPVLQLTIKSIQRCQSLVKPCPTFFYEDGQAKKILNNSIPFVIYKYEYEHILSEWKLSEIDQNLALNNPSFLSLIKKYNFHVFLFNVIYDADDMVTADSVLKFINGTIINPKTNKYSSSLTK